MRITNLGGATAILAHLDDVRVEACKRAGIGTANADQLTKRPRPERVEHHSLCVKCQRPMLETENVCPVCHYAQVKEQSR